VKINSKGNEYQTHHKVAFELVFLKYIILHIISLQKVQKNEGKKHLKAHIIPLGATTIGLLTVCAPPSSIQTRTPNETISPAPIARGEAY
jgi:hypothetical protein